MSDAEPSSPSKVHVQNQLRSNAEDAVGGIAGEAAAESAEAKAAGGMIEVVAKVVPAATRR